MHTRMVSCICIYVQLWVPLLSCLVLAYYSFAPTLTDALWPLLDMLCHRQRWLGQCSYQGLMLCREKPAIGCGLCFDTSEQFWRSWA